MGKKYKIFIILIFYLLIFLILLQNSFSYLDPDLGWHLRAGEQICQDKSINQHDLYNYTLEGKKWINHEWLLDLFSYFIFDNFGYIVLSVFFALLIVSLLAALHLFSKKTIVNSQTKNNFLDLIIVFFLILGALGMSPHLGVRMQEFSIINIFLILLILYNYEKKQNYKILFFLFPLFLVWANMHASFLIGIFFLLLYIFIKFAEYWLVRCRKIIKINFKFNRLLSGRQLMANFVVLLFSFSASLLTPYGVKILSLAERINTFNAFHLKHIAEWLPAYYMPIQYYQLVYSAFASVVLLFIIIDLFKKHGDYQNYKLWHIVFAVLTYILAFKSKRHFPIFFVVSFPLLVSFFYSNLKEGISVFSNLSGRKFIRRYLKALSVIILLAAAIILALNTNFTSNPFAEKKYCQKYPCEAVNFLKNNAGYRDKRLFANYGWGGYIIWTWPGKKLFCDGRLPQYPFAGHTLLAEYFEFFDENSARKKLDQYRIELVLTNKIRPIKIGWFEKYILGANPEKINRQKNALKNYLEDSASWQLVYEDEASCAYARKYPIPQKP